MLWGRLNMDAAPDSLAGRVALITGASRGIGAAVAKAYAQAGAHVVLLARTVSDLEAIDDEIKSLGGQATLIPFDLTKLDELEALGPILDNRFGRLDILVGNAGMLGSLTPLAHSKIKEFQKVITTNVTANVQLIRTCDPLLRASDAGRAIFVVSGKAMSTDAYWGQYAISKAALIALAKTYAAETVTTNVRVNLIRPGVVETAMLSQAYPGGYAGKKNSMDDIVPAFLELASPLCRRHGEMVDLSAA